MEKLTEDHTWNDKLKKLHKKKIHRWNYVENISKRKLHRLTYREKYSQKDIWRGIYEENQSDKNTRRDIQGKEIQEKTCRLIYIERIIPKKIYGRQNRENNTLRNLYK